MTVPLSVFVSKLSIFKMYSVSSDLPLFRSSSNKSRASLLTVAKSHSQANASIRASSCSIASSDCSSIVLNLSYFKISGLWLFSQFLSIKPTPPRTLVNNLTYDRRGGVKSAEGPCFSRLILHSRTGMRTCCTRVRGGASRLLSRLGTSEPIGEVNSTYGQERTVSYSQHSAAIVRTIPWPVVYGVQHCILLYLIYSAFFVTQFFCVCGPSSTHKHSKIAGVSWKRHPHDFFLCYTKGNGPQCANTRALIKQKVPVL